MTGRNEGEAVEIPCVFDTWQDIAKWLRTAVPDRALMLKGAVVIEALAEELTSPAGFHGPHGYLVIAPGLSEEHWRLSNEPEHDADHTSLPMFTKMDPFGYLPEGAAKPVVPRPATNPAAMTERLIDAAIYAETASGCYVGPARKELNEARAAIEAALNAAADLREALRAISETRWDYAAAEACLACVQTDARAALAKTPA